MKLDAKASEAYGNWCGPAAVSLITGCSVRDAYSIISKVRPARFKGRGTRAGRDKNPFGVSTTWLSELLDAVCALGFEATPSVNLDRKKRYTLAAWLPIRKNLDEVNLVRVGHHFVVIHGNRLYDNHNPNGVSALTGPCRRRVVTHCYKIEGKQ